MSLPLVILAAAFGASAGAFVPRVAHRLAVPFGTPARSACAVCARPFHSWVRAGPACRCRRAGWWPAVAGSGFTAGLLAAAIGPDALLPALLLAVVPGVLLAAVDLRCLRLPDAVVGVLAVIVVLPLSLTAIALGEPARLAFALLGAALSGCVYLALAVVSGGGVGLGDAKLATVLGFALGFLGLPALVAGLVAPHLINGPIALFLLVTRRARRGTGLPFGPALLAGALLAITAT
jgi:leader peptidase (prepilin peptidase)/N-methyltransferase